MRLGGILVLVAAMACVLVAAASGGQAFHQTVHDERTFEVEEFCDVEGLTVEIARVIDMRVHIVPHGSSGLVHFLQQGTVSEVLTANGISLTSLATVLEKDVRVTDNGDGTLTVLILATGNAVLYGVDGKAIARNPGQTRFELVVDHGGTPSDPFDDTVVDFRMLKESTGRTDDSCEAAVSALS